MQLVSEPIEFRRMSASQGKNGGMNYYYTFEDSNGSFQLYSKNDFSAELIKGESYPLIFESFIWNNRINYNLVGVYKDSKK